MTSTPTPTDSSDSYSHGKLDTLFQIELIEIISQAILPNYSSLSESSIKQRDKAVLAITDAVDKHYILRTDSEAQIREAVAEEVRLEEINNDIRNLKLFINCLIDLENGDTTINKLIKSLKQDIKNQQALLSTSNIKKESE